MVAQRAIVLSFDRLSRRCLGCYGHEWIETPNLDQLATHAVVFDQHFVSPDAMPLAAPQWAGVKTKVLTEKSTVSDVDPDQLEATPFAQLIASAHEALEQFALQSDQPWLLWLNATGIAWPCVATEEFAALYSDELENGGAFNEIDPLKLAEVAYAACVTQFDHLVGRLQTSIKQLFGHHPPLLIVAVRAGETLGEMEPLPLAHTDTTQPETGWQLRDELVHTPLLIANANSDTIGSRRMELVQLADILPTLHDWFATTPIANSGTQSDTVGRSSEVPAATTDSRKLRPLSLLPLLRNEEVTWRDSIVMQDDDGNTALRSSEFFFVQPDFDRDLASEPPNHEADNPEVSCRLYFKPEDVWELNDVAGQHHEHVIAMRTILRNVLLDKGGDVAHVP